jgi:hypothetical protein
MPFFYPFFTPFFRFSAWNTDFNLKIMPAEKPWNMLIETPILLVKTNHVPNNLEHGTKHLEGSMTIPLVPKFHHPFRGGTWNMEQGH